MPVAQSTSVEKALAISHRRKGGHAPRARMRLAGTAAPHLVFASTGRNACKLQRGAAAAAAGVVDPGMSGLGEAGYRAGCRGFGVPAAEETRRDAASTSGAGARPAPECGSPGRRRPTLASASRGCIHVGYALIETGSRGAGWGAAVPASRIAWKPSGAWRDSRSIHLNRSSSDEPRPPPCTSFGFQEDDWTSGLDPPFRPLGAASGQNGASAESRSMARD